MSIPHISEACRLRDDTVAVGGVFPAVLTNLLNLVDSVKALPPAPDPTALLIDDALAGKAVDLGKLIASAAKAEAESGYAQRLRTNVERDAMRRFAVELRNGGVDAIRASVSPKFEAAAKRVAELREIVDPGWSTEQLVAHGDPDQLAGYREYPGLVAELDKFASLFAQFGRHGNFAVLDQPGHLVHNELIGLRDEALFLTDSDPWRASESINARRAAWQTSPWLRMALRLNTVDDAKERLRSLCESAFDAMESRRGESGRLTDNGYVRDPKRPNPFALAEAA